MPQLAPVTRGKSKGSFFFISRYETTEIIDEIVKYKSFATLMVPKRYFRKRLKNPGV